MHRTPQYATLFIVLMLLQAFLFDNLGLGVWFNPLIYIVFIILLPMESLPVTVVLSGAVLGLLADFFTGGQGLNMAATLPAAFLRQPLLAHLCDRDDLRDGGIPTAERLGSGWRFFQLAATTIVLHHGIYFLLESWSWHFLPHALLRLVLSGGFTLLFSWGAARLFTQFTAAK